MAAVLLQCWLGFAFPIPRAGLSETTWWCLVYLAVSGTSPLRPADQSASPAPRHCRQGEGKRRRTRERQGAKPKPGRDLVEDPRFLNVQSHRKGTGSRRSAPKASVANAAPKQWTRLVIAMLLPMTLACIAVSRALALSTFPTTPRGGRRRTQPTRLPHAQKTGRLPLPSISKTGFPSVREQR